MWGDSWINLQMKMTDLPTYRYKGDPDKEEDEGKPGTIEILNSKFGKYNKKNMK